MQNEGSSYSSSDLASLYTFDTLSELFLQLAHHTPYLTLQWLYVLLLLDWCPQDIWARALLSGGKEASSGMGNLFEGVSLKHIPKVTLENFLGFYTKFWLENIFQAKIQCKKFFSSRSI